MVGKKKLFLTIILLVGIEGHQTRNHYKKIPHINILDFIPIEFQGIIFSYPPYIHLADLV